MFCDDFFAVISVDVDVSIKLTPGNTSNPTSSPNPVPIAAPRQHRAHRNGGTRDDRYRSGKESSYPPIFCVFWPSSNESKILFLNPLCLWTQTAVITDIEIFVPSWVSSVTLLDVSCTIVLLFIPTFLFLSFSSPSYCFSCYSARYPHRGCAGSFGQA